MSLTNCSNCKFYDSNSHHKSDIHCSLQPAYATMYDRLKDLDSVTLNSLPLDPCRDFELNPLLADKNISLSLTFQVWQQLTRDSSCSSTILNFLKDKKIEHSLSLTVQNWQTIANSSRNSYILDTLAEHEINAPQSQGQWIEVDSSCIEAICYRHLVSVLLVRFDGGSVYQYDDIPQSIFDNLLSATSKGRYFNQYIRDCYSCYLMSDSIV